MDFLYPCISSAYHNRYMIVLQNLLQRLLLTTLILAGSAGLSIAQPLPAPKTLNELRQELDSAMKAQHVAGMMLTMVNRDSILYMGGIGYADLENRIPVNEKHLFRLASISKMFTALGVLSMVKEGKLSVNTRLASIAPEIDVDNPWESANPVTIGQLMEHSTGFSDKSPFEEINDSKKLYTGLSGIQVFEKFMHSRWRPGESHAYSGVNYAILEYVIEKISGKSINDYLQQKVFQPLRMPYANMYLNEDGGGLYGKAYILHDGRLQLVPHQPGYKAAYASLHGSAVDMAHALSVYLNDGKTATSQFLTGAIMQDAEKPHTYLSAKHGLLNTYAYGNECYELDGHVFRGHRGAMAGYLSAFLYNRQLGLGYSFSINTFNEAFYQWADERIRSFLLAGTTATPALNTHYTINTKAIAPYEGYYRLHNPGQLYSGFFERLQNTLQVKQQGNRLGVHILLRAALQWEPADSTGRWFADPGSRTAMNGLLRDTDGEQVIVHGTMYFKKISAWQAWTPIVLSAGSVLILLSSLLVCIVVRLVFIVKKIQTPAFLLLLSPVMAAIGLLIIALAITRILEDMAAGISMHTNRQLWLAGSYMLAVFTICNASLLVFQWLQLSSLSRIYFSFTALSGLYIFAVLLLNHWY
jgi:CubicO group peptidase (beta-lactamase class C family)